VHRPSRQSVEEAHRKIRDRLRSQRRKRAIEAFERNFIERYEPMTTCADEYKVRSCGNA